MRIDRANVDAFARLYRAGPARKKPVPRRLESENLDDEIPAGTRLYKTRRERQIEAIDYEDRRWKRYKALRQRRLDKLTSEVRAVSRFLKTLTKVEPTVEALGVRDVDADLAGACRELGIAEIENHYARFTIFEEAVAMVDRVAKRAGYGTDDEPPFFEPKEPTALDELKAELRLR